MQRQGLMLFFTVVSLLMISPTAVARTNPNELTGDDLPVIVKQALAEANESLAPEQRYPERQVFWVVSTEQFIKDMRIRSPEAIANLRNPRIAGFYLSKRVYLLGDKPIYPELKKRSAELENDLFVPVVSALIVHEIAHGLYNDHAMVYELANKHLERLVKLADTKARFQVSHYTLRYVSILKGYLSSMLQEERKHRQNG